jgi:EmrB/QacA subfamily drug resistance transporter
MPERQTNRALTVIGLILTLAMGALEATVVATAMPTVIGDLGGIHYYAWITNAYLIASSVTVPICGKLSDIYGRKPLILFGISIFLLGSVASGAAQTMAQLVVFRAIQGLGAGAMQTMALTIVGDIFDLKERSRMQGVFGAAWGFFGLTGPMLGGLIVHYLSWRWVFYINLPFGVAAMALLTSSFVERIDKRRRDLDFLGAGLLTLGVISLLVAIDRSIPKATLIAAGGAVVFLGAFFAVERVAAEPVIPLPLFARPVMFLSSLAGAIIGGAMMAMLTYVPLYVQSVLRGTSYQGGSAIGPMVVAWPIASALGGRLLPRVGFRPMIRLGLGITAAATLSLALFGTHESLNALRITMAGFGLGMGFANTALLIVVQSSVTWKERGIATASTMFFRTIGGAIAVAVIIGVLSTALRSDPTLPEETVTQLLRREGIQTLDPTSVARLGGVLQHAFGTAFWVIAGFGLAAFVVSLWFPKVVTQDTERKSSEGGPLGSPEPLPPPPAGR